MESGEKVGGKNSFHEQYIIMVKKWGQLLNNRDGIDSSKFLRIAAVLQRDTLFELSSPFR